MQRVGGEFRAAEGEAHAFAADRLEGGGGVAGGDDVRCPGAGDGEPRQGGGEPIGGAAGVFEASGQGGVLGKQVPPEGVEILAEWLEAFDGDAEGDVGEAALDGGKADVVTVDAE